MFERLVEAFKSVFDFQSPRPWPAALGFYLFYLVVGTILASLLSIAAWSVTGEHDKAMVFKIATRTGHIVGALYPTAIYALILYRKNIFNERWPIVGLVFTPLLGGIVSAALGLIPAAIAISMEGNYRRGAR